MSSIQKRPNGRWRARYRDGAGCEHARHFERKVDARRWLDEVTASCVTGQYVDPRAGLISFRDYAEQWRASQVHRPASQAHVETMLRRHAYPTLGGHPLSSILPSEIQAWVKRLGTEGQAAKPKGVGPGHGRSCSFDRLVGVQVSDEGPATRCQPVRRDETAQARAGHGGAATTEQVAALMEAMPMGLRALATFAAGTGMRQGECFGLTVDRLDMLRREVTGDRQLVGRVGMAPEFGPPKTAASVRTIPLRRVVVEALAAHLAAHPPGPDNLVFTLEGEPITRQRFGHLWRPVARASGLPVGTGLHALRHYYASLLIRHGESVKTVQARLGHASAVETLDTYSHLWPDSDDRTREAIDAVLGVPADSVRTGEA